MFKNTRLSAFFAAVLLSVTATTALVATPAFAVTRQHRQQLRLQRQTLHQQQHQQPTQPLRPPTQQLQPKAKKYTTRSVCKQCGKAASFHVYPGDPGHHVDRQLVHHHHQTAGSNEDLSKLKKPLPNSGKHLRSLLVRQPWPKARHSASSLNRAPKQRLTMTAPCWNKSICRPG